MQRLEELKERIQPMGFLFEPTWGKGTKGFKAANIWIGDQYFEMVWLKSPDGGGWKTEWVDKYNRGSRGIVGIFLLTDQLDEIRKNLIDRGVPVSEPERISFRWFFGLFKKTMPWRTMYTDAIPGTDLQICFGELDSPKVMKQMKKYMVPNSKSNSIDGIISATLSLNLTQDVIKYLQSIFPDLELLNEMYVYDMETTKLCFRDQKENGLHVELKTLTSDMKFSGNSFEIENVKVMT